MTVPSPILPSYPSFFPDLGSPYVYSDIHRAYCAHSSGTVGHLDFHFGDFSFLTAPACSLKKNIITKRWTDGSKIWYKCRSTPSTEPFPLSPKLPLLQTWPLALLSPLVLMYGVLVTFWDIPANLYVCLWLKKRTSRDLFSLLCGWWF